MQPIKLSDFLTYRQQEIVREAGFVSMYDIITYLPYTAQINTPFRLDFVSESEIYILTAVLHEARFIPTQGRKYWKLQFLFQGIFIQAFYFNTARYTHKLFQSGEMYQMQLKQRKGLWVISTIRYWKEQNTSLPYKRIGSLPSDTECIETLYHKKKDVTSNLFKTIIQKLPRSAFVLDIQGLVPQNQDFFPTHIDLYSTHFPITLQQYHQSKQVWIAFQVYLQKVLYKSAWSQQNQEKGVPSIRSKAYFQKLDSNNPFPLSYSQKMAIWEISGSFYIDGGL